MTAAEAAVLAEQEASQQRVVAEVEDTDERAILAEYVETVKQEREAQREKARKEQAARHEQTRRHAREQLIERLNARLAIAVPFDRTRIEQTGDCGEWYPAVDFAGLTLAYRRPSKRWADRDRLVIARACERDCGSVVWVEAESPIELVDVLEAAHAHDWPCRTKYNEFGEPITDDDGNPLPPPQPKEPPYDPQRAYREATEKYAQAVRTRRELEFGRPRVKELAIHRILAAGGVSIPQIDGEPLLSVAKSASAAEKLVEFDPHFIAHCNELTDAVVAEIIAREEMIRTRPVYLVHEDTNAV